MAQTAQKMDVSKEVTAIAEQAKAAASALARAPEAVKNKALLEAAKALRENSADILKANQKDTELAKQNGISGALLDRLVLDQKRIAGLGNIYVCEALHRASLSPMRPAGTLAEKNAKATGQAEALALAIRTVLQEAVAAGGSSLKDFAAADGSLGYFQHRFRVYDQEGEPCPSKGCGGRVERLVQAGRSTFYCARCQK